jgi:GntR family transcriptional regulator/MocR family aminotransferase
VWARAPGVDVDLWAERARAAGVAFQTARLFTFDERPREYVRLGFAACNEERLFEAARRLAAALPG